MMPCKRWQTTTLLVAVLVAVAVAAAAPSVVYAEQYRDTPSSDRLARAEQDVHDVREALARAEHPTLVSRVANFFSGSKPSGDAASNAGRAYDSVKQSVGRAFGPEQIEQALHKLKVSIGVEQPTVWEKIRRTFGMDRSDSITDQLRYAFGYEPVTEGGFFQRLAHSLTGESESTFTQVRRAIGLEPSSSSDWYHKLKVALGTDDPTVWERVKSAIEPSWREKLLHPFTSNTQLTADHVVQRVKEGLTSLDPRHQDTVMEKVKKAVGWQPQGLVDRITGKYGTGLQETVETGAQLTQEVASAAVDRANEFVYGNTYDDMMHKMKMAIGIEDPTAWENIKAVLERPQSLTDHLRNWIGAEGMTRGDLMDRLSASLAKLDPRKRETTLEKVKKAIGLETPNTLDKARDVVGDKAQQLVDSASKLLSGSSFDDALQRVKAAVSGEDSTVWETIQSALTSHESIPDKMRHLFGRNRGISPSDLFEKIKNSIPEMSRRESTLEKIKKALGLQEPGFLDKLRGGIQETADEFLPSDKLQDLSHRAAMAIGLEDPTTWESIKSAFDFQPTLMDRVKGVLGRSSGMTREGILERVKEGLREIDPRRRDTILEKLKKVVGLQEPSLIDRVKQTFGTAQEKVEETWEKANEVLRGNSYDEVIHQLKELVGREDPSLWEQIEEALHPRESLGDKMRHIFGRDSGVTRNAIVQRIQEALSSLSPTRRESWMRKIKTTLGLQEPSLLGRAKEKIDHFLGRDQTSIGPSIEQALNTFRTSSPDNRESAYNSLRKALEDARTDMKDKTASLYELLGGHYDDRSGVSKAMQEMEHKFQGLYDSFQNTLTHWKDGLTHFVQTKGRGSSWLLEATNEENGRTTHYINDNGHEFLDVTGGRVDDRSFDKLRAINAFRYEFNLKPHDSLPSNCSVQVHSTKRPHVLIKSSKLVDGNRYDYCFDDGQESLTVEWRDGSKADKTLDHDQQQRLLTEFRAQYGLPIPADHEPSHVRGQIRRFKDDL